MLYDYILTAFKLVVGLVTTERLIYGALIFFAFYLVWVCASLMFSFQRKFNVNCVKLYNFIKKTPLSAENAKIVDLKIAKISSGFNHGWSMFKSSSSGKPSDYITRREALDVEVTGGVLNQGKTLMRAFINISTFGLFLLNFAYLGSNNTITCYLIAESMVLPFIYFAVMKVFYFLYTSVKQQLYKSDIECFYDLVDLLDATFAGTAVREFSVQEDIIAADGDEAVLTEAVEIDKDAMPEESEQESLQETEEESEQEEEDPKKKTIDDYDIFKKKNIDVDKLVSGEVPTTGSVLPFINVDSDYVIKDTDNDVPRKPILNEDDTSLLLGGMIQDGGSIKKQEEYDEAVKTLEEEKSKEEALENKATEDKKEEPQTTEEKEEDPFAGLEKFNVGGELPSDVGELPKDEVKEESQPAVDNSETTKEESITEESTIANSEDSKESDELEDKKANLENIISSFKPKRSKLASGGVVIERNEPIARRERAKNMAGASGTNYAADVEELAGNNEPVYNQAPEITQLAAPEDVNNVLNSLKSTPGSYEPVYQDYMQGSQPGSTYPDYIDPSYNAGYGYQDPYGSVPGYMQQPYGATSAGSSYSSYNQVQYNSPSPYQGAGQNAYNQSIDVYGESYQEDDYSDEEEDVEEDIPAKAPRKTAKKSQSKNTTKKGAKKVKMEEKQPEPVKSNRGRPRKPVFDDQITIKDDKEFDSVLARAEKLMRKSDEGLSQSQSKRIEKELKMLMDAMNRYKEGK